MSDKAPDTLNVVPQLFIDVLPQGDHPPPALSTGSDRPVTIEEKAPNPNEGKASGEALHQAAEAEAAAAAAEALGEAEKAPGEPSDEPAAKEPKPDLTPKEEKAYITREKNRRRLVEEQLATTQKQLSEVLELARKFIPDPNASKPEPKLEAFEDHASYIEAKADWLAQQRVATLQREQTRQAQESEQQRLNREHLDRIEAAEKDYPGIGDIARDPTLPVSPAMGAFIMKSKDGPRILHWLDEHRDDARRLAAADPVDALAELGEIRALLRATKEPQRSKAPEPIKPVGSNGAVKKSVYEMNDEEYWADYEARKAAKLKAIGAQRTRQ